MTTLIVILSIADIVIALLLIALILVQQSKQGALGSAFGGVGESVFGVQAASHLSKLTIGFAVSFLIVTLTIAVLTGHRKTEQDSGKGLLDKETVMDSKKAGEVKPDAEKASKDLTAKSQETEVLPDGTKVIKTEGGTITMKPVAAPNAAAPAAPKGNKEQKTEVLPDGTRVITTEGGTIRMTPVKAPAENKTAEEPAKAPAAPTPAE